MWADDLEIVESCGFDLSLSYFDSINSIGVFAATDTFAHMKAPNHAWFYVPTLVLSHEAASQKVLSHLLALAATHSRTCSYAQS